MPSVRNYCLVAKFPAGVSSKKNKEKNNDRKGDKTPISHRNILVHRIFYGLTLARKYIYACHRQCIIEEMSGNSKPNISCVIKNSTEHHAEKKPGKKSIGRKMHEAEKNAYYNDRQPGITCC